jgi:Mn-dependent DtxR family transcriptional regulator
MREIGLVETRPHPPIVHDHKTFVNPCHDALKPAGVSIGDGSMILELTSKGRQRAADIIRRHRLAERLFTDSLAMDSETEIEQQACKFEHILSPEATDKICTFLGHPKTCPHGAPIPQGRCCEVRDRNELVAETKGKVVAARPYTDNSMNERHPGDDEGTGTE